MNKNILVLILVLLAAVAGIFFLKKGKEAPVTSPEPTQGGEVTTDGQGGATNQANQIDNETKAKIEALSEKLKNNKITKEEFEKQVQDVIANSPVAKKQFETQRKNILASGKILKEYRKCLGTADTKAAAETCFKELMKKAEDLGLELTEKDKTAPTEFANWSKEKKAFLAALDRDIELQGKVEVCYKDNDMKVALECLKKIEDSMRQQAIQAAQEKQQQQQ